MHIAFQFVSNSFIWIWSISHGKQFNVLYFIIVHSILNLSVANSQSTVFYFCMCASTMKLPIKFFHKWLHRLNRSNSESLLLLLGPFAANKFIINKQIMFLQFLLISLRKQFFKQSTTYTHYNFLRLPINYRAF